MGFAASLLLLGVHREARGAGRRQQEWVGTEAAALMGLGTGGSCARRAGSRAARRTRALRQQAEQQLLRPRKAVAQLGGLLPPQPDRVLGLCREPGGARGRELAGARSLSSAARAGGGEDGNQRHAASPLPETLAPPSHRSKVAIQVVTLLLPAFLGAAAGLRKA